MSASHGDVGPWEFYRGYTRTAVHAAATAALTAFGLLTTVHPAFAVVAIAAYVLPPLYLYATRDDEGKEATAGTATERTRDHRPEPDERNREKSDEGDEGEDEEAGTTDLGWTVARTPTDATLRDVAAAADGIHAVGEGGVVLSRTDEEWGTTLDAGPAAEGRTLNAVDATADGEAAWVAGDGGALGRISDGRHADHSAPRDITGSWTGVAVAGPAGEETVVLGDSSGQLLRGEYAEGEIEWGEPTKPGSGSSVAAVAFLDADLGHACDTNAGVYETRDGGGRFERIGVEGAGAFADVAASGAEDVWAAAADGALHRYDGSVWTRLDLGTPARALALDGERGLACGDGGTIHELAEGTWEPCETPVSPDLHGVCLGDVAVAVGADGTVLERDG